MLIWLDCVLSKNNEIALMKVEINTVRLCRNKTLVPGCLSYFLSSVGKLQEESAAQSTLNSVLCVKCTNECIEDSQLFISWCRLAFRSADLAKLNLIGVAWQRSFFCATCSHTPLSVCVNKITQKVLCRSLPNVSGGFMWSRSWTD